MTGREPVQVVIPYKAQPRQLDFHESAYKYRLYGGSAGSGKSLALLMEAVRQCLAVSGWTALILRESYNELQQSQILRFKTLVPADLYKWSERQNQATFINGSTLRFGYLDSDDRVTIYQGDEYGFIGFDELTHFSLFQWSYLTSRNRWVPPYPWPENEPKPQPNMAGATNPGGRGHQWVRALWVDKKPAPEMEAYEYDPELYEFIPAKVTDNPALMESNPEYVKSLERLPTALRAALLDGSWDILAGAFYDRWSRDRMVVARHGDEEPEWCPRWAAIDWGYDHPSAVLWAVKGEDGRTLVYRETVVKGKTPAELGRLIVDVTGGERLSAVYLSHDAFNRRTSPRTIAQEISDELTSAHLPACSRADNDRKGGAMLVNQMMAEGQLVVSLGCPQLIERIPRVQRDPDNPGDTLKENGDDLDDALRYLLKTRERSVRVPEEVTVHRAVEPFRKREDWMGGMVAWYRAKDGAKAARRAIGMSLKGRRRSA